MVEIHGSPYGAKIDNTEIDTSDSYTMAGLTISAGGQLTLPSVTTAQRDALTPATGMIVYNTDTASIQKYNGTVWENAFSWHLYASGSATGQSTFTISSLPSKYMWKLYAILTPNDNSWLKFRINGDSGNNYDYYQLEGTTVNDYKNQGQVHLGDSTSGMPLPLEILFNGKVGSGGKINVQLHRHDTRPSDGKSFQIFDGSYHGGSSDVSSISFNIDSGSFDIKYALYYQEDIEGL